MSHPRTLDMSPLIVAGGTHEHGMPMVTPDQQGSPSVVVVTTVADEIDIHFNSPPQQKYSYVNNNTNNVDTQSPPMMDDLEMSLKQYEARVKEFEELSSSMMAQQQQEVLNNNSSNTSHQTPHKGVNVNDSASVSLSVFSKDDTLAHATTLNNMAFLYQKMEMSQQQQQQSQSASNQSNHSRQASEKALKAYKKSLKLKKETLGSNHVSVATTLNNMGSVYFSRGDYKKALKAYEKALQVMIVLLGDDHLNVATVHNNIGDVHYCVGDDAKALRAYTAAFNIRELHLAQEDVRVSRLHDKICLILWRRDVQEAVLIEQEAGADVEKDYENLKDEVSNDLNWLDNIANDLNREVDTQCQKLSPQKNNSSNNNSSDLPQGVKRRRCVLESDGMGKVEILAASTESHDHNVSRKKRRVNLTVWSTILQ